MYWIGLTGGIATGKSTVAIILNQLGVPVLDADYFAKEALDEGSPFYSNVISVFGPSILNTENKIDRTALGKIVFSEPKKLAELEALTHPFIKSRVAEEKEKLKKQGESFAVYDVPLLFEKKMMDQFDFIVTVTCQETLQIERMKKRNQWSDAEIQNRLKSQLPLKDKEAGSDFIIKNDGNLEELILKVQDLVEKIKTKIK